MSDFTAGESGDNAPDPITQEQMGAPTGITASLYPAGAAYGAGPQRSAYLMPPYHGRNGSNERCAPGISLTPLGGLMPGPNAIAPAIPSGAVGAYLHEPAEDGGFQSGVIDSWPEGSPVPLR